MARSSATYGSRRTSRLILGVAGSLLLAIVFVGTWRGLRDVLAGTPVAARLLAWNLPVAPETLAALTSVHDLLLAASAVVLIASILLALRTAVRWRTAAWRRAIAMAVVLAGTTICVTLVYGACWSLMRRLDARAPSVEDWRADALLAADFLATRASSIRLQLDQAAALSTQRSSHEESATTLCGIALPGDRVSLVNARRGITERIAGLREAASESWLVPALAEADALRRAEASLRAEARFAPGEDAGRLAYETRVLARTGLQRMATMAKPFADRLRMLADTIAIAPGQAGFSCHDPGLAARLQRTALLAASPSQVRFKSAVFDDGPAGVANAVHMLLTDIDVHLAGLTAYTAWSRALAGDAHPFSHTADGEPIDNRDMLALLLALGLDLGGLSIAGALLTGSPRRRSESSGPAVGSERSPRPDMVQSRRIVMAVRSAADGAPGMNLGWIRRHFVQHHGATYYVIPDIGALPSSEEVVSDQTHRALALNQLAGMLVDLDQLQPVDQNDAARLTGPASEVGDGSAAGCSLQSLQAKAALALDAAGWMPPYRRRLEIFRAVRASGGIPLLCLIDEAERASGHLHQPAADTVAAGEPPSPPNLLRLEYRATT